VSTYAYLGPAATFTEAALKNITGPTDQLIPYANVTAALNAVRNNEAEFALVPIENSIEGVVARTLDELATGDPLIIAGEVTLPVSFAFMIKPGTKEINRIATHPHAEAQCRTYVATNYPHAEVVATNSTAAAAEALNRGEFDAAIASAVAADRYGLEIVAENIGDNTEAVTRFVLVSKPGELTEFATRNVNLTFIQSRPTGRELGDYHFIVDAEGHISDANVGQAVARLREICEEIRFLGSYPREESK
jgi:prephenate dehydratase